MTDPDAIVLVAANGASVRDIARAHELTETEVRSTIDQQAARCFDGEQLRREWLLEAKRPEALGMKYYERAMAGDGDVNSGALYVKISERRATLTGMNATQGFAVQVIHQTAPPPDTMQEMRSELDELMNRPMLSGARIGSKQEQ